METVLLVILLLIALGLIGVVLLQRSEGGGLGIGGGGGGGGMMSSRSAATALSKVTWVLGAGFMAAALALTIIAARNSSGASVLDRITDAPVAAPTDLNDSPAVDGDSLLPPVPLGDDTSPLVPDGN